MADTALSPPPEDGPQKETAEQLMASLQSHAAAHGYALIKANAANYREGKPTSYGIFCDRGKRKKSVAKGLRNEGSRKMDCPFKGKMVAKKINDWRWTFEVKEPAHNHGPSTGMTDHPILRRLTDSHRIHIKALAKHGVRRREILASLEESFPDHPFKTRDIDNYLQKLRRDKLASQPAAQAPANSIEDQGTIPP